MTRTFVIKDFTRQEADWLTDLIAEKLNDLGKEVSGFNYSINVEIEEESND